MRINTINRFFTSNCISADISAIAADIECAKDSACNVKKTLAAIERRLQMNQGRLSPRDVQARKDCRSNLTIISNRLTYLNKVLDEAVQVRDTRKKGAWLIERAAQPVTQPVTETVTATMVAPIVNRKTTPKPLPFLGRKFNLTDPNMTFDKKAALFTVRMAWAKRAKTLAVA